MSTDGVTPLAERIEGADAVAQPLVEVLCDDFLRNSDGTWEIVRDVFVAGETGGQLLLRKGRRFGKGEMFFFGLDLATLLERYSP